jgi:hypothetical protein
VAKPKPKEEAPKANAFEVRRVNKPSEFRRFYDRGDLPLCVDFQGASRKVPFRVLLSSSLSCRFDISFEFALVFFFQYPCSARGLPRIQRFV